MNKFRTQFTVYHYHILAALFGALLFIIVWGWQLDISRIDWIMAPGGDLSQHYLGWKFFRNAPLAWPLGFIPSLAYPLGAPLALTDSIPLLAFIFRPFANYLPETFQYLGIWGLVSLTLQGWFGFLLTKKYLGNNERALLASTLFVLTPLLLSRITMHTALTAHWLILAALYLLLTRKGKVWTWTLLTALAILVHPYLALIVLGTCLLAALREKTFTMFGVSALVLIVLAWTIGLFHGQAGAVGYGFSTLSLDALLNPMGWSSFLPTLPTGPYQFEGLVYPGLGVLFLLATVFLNTSSRNTIKTYITASPYLFWASVILILVAISHQVWLGDTIIASLSLPRSFVEDIFGIVRASGRLVWPVYYLVLTALIAMLAKRTRKTQLLILSIALALQLLDLRTPLIAAHTRSNVNWQSPLQDQLWQELPKYYDHLWIMPAVSSTTFTGAGYEPLALYAAENNLTLNTAYFSRPLRGLSNQMQEGFATLISGGDAQTAYIFFDPPEIISAKANISPARLRTANEYTVYLPRHSTF